MVKCIKALFCSGTVQWVLQRVSAVVLLAYMGTLLWLWFSGMPADYALWHDFLAQFPMQVLAVLSLLSLVVHAWIGFWTVATDYIKCPPLRNTVLALLALYLFGILFFGLVFIGS